MILLRCSRSRTGVDVLKKLEHFHVPYMVTVMNNSRKYVIYVINLHTSRKQDSVPPSYFSARTKFHVNLLIMTTLHFKNNMYYQQLSIQDFCEVIKIIKFLTFIKIYSKIKLSARESTQRHFLQSYQQNAKSNSS